MSETTSKHRAAASRHSQNPLYWPQLDGLRAIAVAAVLLHHGSYGHLPGGFLGVDLFFVLSGFLITTLLVREWRDFDRIDFFRFYMRRVLRLFPALVAAVLLAAIVWPSDPDSPPYPRMAFAAAFYHMNFMTIVPHPLLHTWSLSIEEQFYFVWPPLLAILLMLRTRLQLMAVLTLIGIAVAVRFSLFEQGADPVDINRSTLGRMDSLLSGAAAALIYAYALTKRLSEINANRIALVCLVALGVEFVTVSQESRILATWGYTVAAAQCAVLISAVVQLSPDGSSLRRMLCSRSLRYLGQRSYGLYLYHFPIFPLFEVFRVQHSYLNFVAVLALRLIASAVLAELSFRLIESPFLRLKRGFEPGMARTTA
jgi:peptidoglycan/LPS O-acetylase OafA/YrhL